MQTLDLDLVHDRSPANLSRLHSALLDLEACYREHLPARVLKPGKEDLASRGHHLLMTTAGPLDLLGSIGRNRDHDDLVDHVDLIEILPGLIVRVLDLPTLIQVKEEVGREKDRAILPLLRSTLEERRRRGGA
jgi:hypothetical protein